ncbi:hypothetical protein [Streptomyces sp. NPDC001985]|uniref:hypothetical protein n=1 Tax=Streptomyces sp. NPDC001985 TaxID=3154406 RepID=UPI003331EDC5
MSRMLLYSRRTAMGLVALLLLTAGCWSSWGTAQHVMLAKGREHGTITVTGCDGETCTGRFDPEGTAGTRNGMTMEKSLAVKEGATLSVVVKPGTSEVVRRGTGGVFQAWLPLGGAMVLAALIIGGGMRLPRFAWVTAGVGGAVLVGAFLTL